MLLKIENLDVRYGKIKALDNVSINVEKGQLTTLLGANGAGKSTLLKTISKLLKPAQGTMIFDGRNLEKFSADKIVRSRIAHCPEGRKVFPRQTVYENLKMGAYIRNDKDVEKDIQRFFEKFPRIGERRQQMAGHLSGGEQQMLVICRALMSRPKLLLLDEPSMGLAPFVVRAVFKLIREIVEEGTTVLLVEQNAKQALKIANRAYILEVGRIVAEDDAKVLLNSAEVRKSYLGA